MVEKAIFDNQGRPGGIARIYTGSQARAEFHVANDQANGGNATWREIDLDDPMMPEQARANLERAAREAAQAN